MGIIYSILGVIVLIIILALFIPLKIKMNFNVKTDDKGKFEKTGVKNEVKIYLFGFLLIKTIDQKSKEKAGQKKSHSSSKIKAVIDDGFKMAEDITTYEKINSLLASRKDFNKLTSQIKFSEFSLSLGYNLQEPILNAYMMAFLNAVINMYFSKNIDKIKIEKTTYNTYLSERILDLSYFGIIHFKLANTIIVIVKILINLRKVAKRKNGKTTTSH